MVGKRLALVVAADDNYIVYAITTIKSFLFHNRWFDGDIITFDDGKIFTISEKNRERLRSIYKKVVIRNIDYSKYDDVFKEVIKAEKNSGRFIKSYTKFEIFNFLKDYDKILCVDADVLFVDNVKDLFMQDIAFGVTSSMLANYYLVTENKEYKHFKKNDKLINIDSGGFNAGVMYIGDTSLLNFNTDSIIGFTYEMLSNYEENDFCIMFFDQCILNYFFDCRFREQVTLISPAYNLVVGNMPSNKYKLLDSTDSDFLKNLFVNSKIFHFVMKPEFLNANGKLFSMWNFYRTMPVFR